MSFENKEVKISNKGYLITGAVILIVALCVFCAVTLGKNSVLKSDDTSVSFNLKVTCNVTEVIYDKTVSTENGESLMDILKENLDVTEKDGFITSICGKEQNDDKNRYWMYTVNGKSSQVGASEYKPADGDEIVFDLSELSWE